MSVVASVILGNVSIVRILSCVKKRSVPILQWRTEERRVHLVLSNSKNKITFFKQEEISSGVSSKERTLKEDCHLFSQLFISCQSRQYDLHDFFQHENQSAPASLSDSGKLHTCQKSQLVEILESKTLMPNTEPEADAITIDGSLSSYQLPTPTCVKDIWWLRQWGHPSKR